MVKTLLFDLDGTLLDVDMEVFLPAYLKALAPRVARALPPQRFVADLLASTAAMVRNEDPSRTNQQVFLADFFGRTGLRPEEWMPVFDDFYRTDFHRLRSLTAPRPVARRLVETAVELGYEVVVATNPVFPLIAIEARLAWANLAGLPFRLVTSYEIMHFSKPNPRYYAEILDMLGRKADECVMIGNDAGEDMVACQAGLKTFLTREGRIDRGTSNCPPTWEGSLEDVLARVEQGRW
ncbi:MAG TPA: HAD family hydrolase [Firmicutes bacterium]|nr:HAD family hydrolase [Bacillota bacterium]